MTALDYRGENRPEFQGTARNLEELDWLLTDTFPKDGNLEPTILKDINDQSQFQVAIGAAATPSTRSTFHFDGGQWNDDSREIAWASPLYNLERGGPVYVESKAEAQRAFWKFVKEEKPSCRSNSGIVDTVFGPQMHEKTKPFKWCMDLGAL
ncbi:hypothetical protein ACHAQJ_006595 [Trichoderma viride]